MKNKIHLVAKEIIKFTGFTDVKILNKKTIGSFRKKFFFLMRKYNIKEGTPFINSEGKHVGRTMKNPDWVMCEGFFWQRVLEQIQICDLFGDSTPKDLRE